MALTQAFVVGTSQPALPAARLPSKPAGAAHEIQERGFALALATVSAALTISSSRRRVARRAAKDSEQQQSFLDSVSQRRRSAVAAVATGAAAAPLAANAETNICSECDGTGLCSCPMCEGGGQYRLWGSKYEKTSMRQYLTCPECNGVGELVCQKCSGTGLPGSKLKGLMRDPIFAKVAYRLKKQRIDVNTVDKMRVDVRKAVAAAEKRVKEKEAEAAAQSS